MRFLSNVADLVALNLVWLMCSLPMVTIGLACTAMCYTAREITKGNSPMILKTFFRAFQENSRQSLAMSLLLLIPVILAASYLLMTASDGLEHIPRIEVSVLPLHGDRCGGVLLCVPPTG